MFYSCKISKVPTGVICLVMAWVLALSPVTAASSDYYVVENGAQTGPFARNLIANRVQLGDVTRETLVWTQGMADWAPAGTVPSLENLFQAATPPLPDAGPQDFNAFIQGVWVADPVNTPVPGMGQGTVTGQTTYSSDGQYAFTGQIDVTDAQGQPQVIGLTSTGQYGVTALGDRRFQITFSGPLVMTVKGAAGQPDGVQQVEVPPGVFDVIDQNTLRDAQGSVSRRKIQEY